MTKENACFDKPLLSSESFRLQVSVIAGRHLSIHRLPDGSVRKSPTNTFVKIEIIGHDVDRAVGWTKICQVCISFDFVTILTLSIPISWSLFPLRILLAPWYRSEESWSLRRLNIFCEHSGIAPLK